MIYEYRTSLKGKVLIMTKNITFLESHEALQAKKDVETDQVFRIGNLDDLNKWMDNL